MIADYNRYYGCVFTAMIDGGQSALRIRRLDVGVLGFYTIEENIGLYIKFSRNRKGPWTFNFQRDHQLQWNAMVSERPSCITALVCGSDGIVALSPAQLNEILSDPPGEQEAITVRRKLRHMYSLTGKNGKLERKVARDSLSHLMAEAGLQVDRNAEFVAIADSAEQL
jgi:hypothetical protein